MNQLDRTGIDVDQETKNDVMAADESRSVIHTAKFHGWSITVNALTHQADPHMQLIAPIYVATTLR